jgi:hypothetical protein
VKGGRVIGRSDDIGAYPAERPVNPSRSSRRSTRRSASTSRPICPGPAARPYPVVDFGVQPIKELF